MPFPTLPPQIVERNRQLAIAARVRAAAEWRALGAKCGGFENWAQGIEGTAHLSGSEAAEVLHCSRATVVSWRQQLGVVSTRPRGRQALAEAFRADPYDERHGSANAYRNRGCRCEPCKEAWSAYQRERYQSAKRERDHYASIGEIA